jgi:ABC-type amino acid transport substrate-binding protein
MLRRRHRRRIARAKPLRRAISFPFDGLPFSAEVAKQVRMHFRTRPNAEGGRAMTVTQSADQAAKAALVVAGWLMFCLLTCGLLPAAETTVLRVGMDTRSRPWAFVPGLYDSKEAYDQPPKISASQLGLLQGTDIDFMKALARRLNAVPKVVPFAWPKIEEGLVSKEFDVLINGWQPNSRTPAGIVASSPYFEWGLLIVVRAANTTIRSYRDLAGTRVGYYSDRIVDRTVQGLGAGSLVPLEDSDRLFQELAAGRVDALVEDSTYVRWRVAHDSSFRVVGERLNRLSYNVGLRREDKALYQKVEVAIRELIEAGEIERIRARWASAVDSPGPDD